MGGPVPVSAPGAMRRGLCVFIFLIPRLFSIIFFNYFFRMSVGLA